MSRREVGPATFDRRMGPSRASPVTGHALWQSKGSNYRLRLMIDARTIPQEVSPFCRTWKRRAICACHHEPLRNFARWAGAPSSENWSARSTPWPTSTNGRALVFARIPTIELNFSNRSRWNQSRFPYHNFNVVAEEGLEPSTCGL